jgi:hypothetical protein
MSARLYALHAEAVLSIVVGDPLDDPCRHLLSGLLGLNLHETSISEACGGQNYGHLGTRQTSFSAGSAPLALATWKRRGFTADAFVLVIKI